MDRSLERGEDPRQRSRGAPPLVPDRRERDVARPRIPPFALPREGRREAVEVRGRTYHLRETESRTLEVAGTFRVAFTRDLAIGVYDGNRARLMQDLQALAAAGLLERRPFARNPRGETLEVVALTRDGQRLLEARRSYAAEHAGEPRQLVYAGFGPPPDLLHDATLYRVFLEEQGRLSREGAVVRRVLLDSELKAQLLRAAQIDRPRTADERQAHLVSAATRLGLPIVEGHVQIPDLRLEIDDDAGRRTRVDLELTTQTYHGGKLRTKVQAGFGIYRAVPVGAGRARLVLGASSQGRGHAAYDHDLASPLLSL